MCHINREHRVPKETYYDHVETCLWAKEGYGDELPLSEPNHSSASILLSKLFILVFQF